MKLQVMTRVVPVWFLLLCLLLFALFMVAFGWSISSTLRGHDTSGRFGDAAVAIASFPKMVREVFTQLLSDADREYRVPRVDVNLSEFTPITAKPGIDVKGLVMRADKAALARAPGWRILVGAFTIGGKPKNAALVLSPELEIVKVWVLTEEAVDGEEPRPPHRKFVHGFDILRDGSIIFTFDGGVSLQRLDKCGSRIWAVGGAFNHTVTLDDSEEFVWSLLLGNEQASGIHIYKETALITEVVKVATATGEIVRRFSMNDIITANPEIDILEIRKVDGDVLGYNTRNKFDMWLSDPFHVNDIDPLPAALANRFEDFHAGDLLLSVRSLNLVFVMDPDTLKVKWWRVGAVRRQHDPDWASTGQIIVYDNRMSRDYSRIVSIEPRSYRTQVLFHGRVNDFYSRIRGKHQFTEAGNLIVTSSQQGRVFEIDPNGDAVLEIFNQKVGSDEFNYSVSEAIWLSPDTFNFSEDLLCKN